jgi:hypothetical protein
MTAEAALNALPALDRAVLGALALGALPRSRTWLASVLEDPGLRPDEAKRPGTEALREALARLFPAGWLVADARRQGFWSVADTHLPEVWCELLDRHEPEALRVALGRADQYLVHAGLRGGYHSFPTLEAAVARLRLEALIGASPQDIALLAPRLSWGLSGLAELGHTVLAPIQAATLLARLHPAVRAEQLQRGLEQLLANWEPQGALEVLAQTEALLQADDSAYTLNLRELLAEAWLWMGRAEELPELLKPLLHHPELPGSVRDTVAARLQALQAAGQALQGHWAAAEAGADEALAKLRKLTGKRRGLLPDTAALAYALALLAQRTPAHLAKALKFCLGEGGKREPVLDGPPGFIALALRMKLGDQPRDLAPFKPYLVRGSDYLSPMDFWRWLMRAWLKEGAQAEALSVHELEAAGQLLARLKAAGLPEAERQLAAALQVLNGEPAPPPAARPPACCGCWCWASKARCGPWCRMSKSTAPAAGASPRRCHCRACKRRPRPWRRMTPAWPPPSGKTATAACCASTWPLPWARWWATRPWPLPTSPSNWWSWWKPVPNWKCCAKASCCACACSPPCTWHATRPWPAGAPARPSKRSWTHCAW